MSARSRSDRYRWAAPIYDLAALIWSGGAIWRTRAHALRFAEPGKTLLVPGAGTGRLALEAAKLGAETVALDRSPAMYARAKRRTERAAARAKTGAARINLDLRLASLEDLPPSATFDVVVAEHFLNVFTPEEMPAIRERLIGLTRAGGTLVIADFSPVDPQSSRWVRAAQRMHHVIPLGGCALLTGNAMHPIFDHGRDLEGRGDLLALDSVDEPSFRVGPRWFRTWTFRKLEALP
jgi:ubiquinone/menaquinone biosynthesis C-methylase UbiE